MENFVRSNRKSSESAPIPLSVQPKKRPLVCYAGPLPMLDNFRRFRTEPDPFGRAWDVEFRWLQTGISIRHADTVDVKFHIWTGTEPKEERVVALNHPDLLALSKKTGHALTDPWCMKLAALHLKYMIETDEDMEKTLVTMSYPDLEKHAATLHSMSVPAV